MAFQNRLAILINAPLFERELRKYFNRRCDYQRFLDFLTDENQNSVLNNKEKLNDIVRANYFYAQTVFRDNQFVSRTNANHTKFLNALRMMGYEVTGAYNSIDAHLCISAAQLAENASVDTVLILGATIDHVPTIWYLRSKGIRVVGVFSDTRSLSERIKEALHWHYQIHLDDGFLSEENKSSHSEGAALGTSLDDVEDVHLATP